MLNHIKETHWQLRGMNKESYELKMAWSSVEEHRGDDATVQCTFSRNQELLWSVLLYLASE